jgi:hypothetical protein
VVVDSSGNVVNSASIGSNDTITIHGGTDTFTGQEITGDLVTKASYTVATPITTLLASGADAASIAKALHISGVDITTFDPIAAMSSTNHDAAVLGQQVFTTQQQLFTIEQTLDSLVPGQGQALLAQALNTATPGADLSTSLNSITQSAVTAAITEINPNDPLAASKIAAITHTVDLINANINTSYSSYTPSELAAAPTSASSAAGMSQTSINAIHQLSTTHDVTLLTNTANAADITALHSTIPCYVKGTHLETSMGPKLVEELKVGDLILTVDGRQEPVIWIGSRRVITQFQTKKDKAYPVRIVQDAFGENLPMRDLLVSPDHSLYVDGVMIPADKLLNGKTIIQEKWSQVTYFHVELPKHEAVYAEGLPAETYLDTSETNRAFFNNALGEGKVFDASEEIPAPKDVPLWRHIWDTQGYGKLTTSGPVLESVKARLNNRADEMTQKVSKAA